MHVKIKTKVQTSSQVYSCAEGGIIGVEMMKENNYK